jgi:hypothetical protein
MRIEQGLHGLLSPGIEFFCWERLEESVGYGSPSAHRSEYPTVWLLNQRDQSNQRFLATRNDDLFTPAGFLDQAREMGFGGMNRVSGHG